MNRSEGTVSVETDGVSVTKSVNDHQFESLAVVINIRSDVASPLNVTVSDAIPDDVDSEAIRFPSEYGDEHWQVETTEVRFTQTIEPGMQITAIYEVPGFERDRTELLSEPSVEVVAEGSMTGEDADGVPATSSTESPPLSDKSEPKDEAETVLEYDTDGLANELAEELRTDEISSEDRELLREQLLPRDSGTDARIKHLQRQVADLNSYTAALEAFLDEEEGAEAVINELRERVEDLSADVQEIRETNSDVKADVEDLQSNLENIDDSVEDLEAEVSEVSSDLDTLGDRTESLEDDVRTIDADLEQLESLDGQLDSIEADIDDMEDDIADFTALHDRLSSMFGPSEDVQSDQTDEKTDASDAVGER